MLFVLKWTAMTIWRLEMSGKKLLAVFFFCLLAFSPIFFRPFPYGSDSYWFFGQVCQKGAFEAQPTGVLSLFPLIPCNFGIANLLLFACLFLSCASISLLGLVFNKKGWLAGIFAFGSLNWLLNFWQFENEAFAYPIIFFGIALFYWGLKQKRFFTTVFGIATVATGSFFFWFGGFYWIIAMALTWSIAGIIVLPLFFLPSFWEAFARNLRPYNSAVESFSAFGFLYQGLLLIGITKMKKARLLMPALLFFCFVAFLNAKFAVLLTPVLAVLSVFWWESSSVSYKAFFAVTLVLIVLVQASMVFDLPPNAKQIEAVQLAVKEAKGETIFNDWSFGHWISFFGGKPLAAFGGSQPPLDCSGCVVLTVTERPWCKQLNDSNFPRVYRC
jgi:hypothetical protein